MKTCSKCHVMKSLQDFSKNRSTKDGLQDQCKVCRKQTDRTWAMKNPVKQKALKDKWRFANLEKAKRASKNWKLQHPEAVKRNQYRYRQRNMWKVLARNSLYRARLLRRVPAWLTSNDLYQIREFYKQRPVGYHVDHIYPLCGDRVSGLHVITNLQYLSASANCRKGNRIPA